MDTPRQLPPRRGPLVDREQERTLLHSALLDQSGRPRLVLITGLGGSGKTALAVETGHRLATEFPGGQLFADLGASAASGQAQVADILAGFLLALGIRAEHLPAHDVDRIALYRTRTAERRLLVVLDDAHDAAQIRPLLPASEHSGVVITSRSRLSELALDGVRHVAIANLSPSYARELITTLVGAPTVLAEPDAADQLAAICDGHPLALSIACALVTTRPARALAWLSHELHSRAEVLNLALGAHTIRGVLDVTFDHLSPLASAVAAAMSCHPGIHFDVDTAAAALDRSIDDVRAALDELVEANVLQEHPANLFDFHNLARDHVPGRVVHSTYHDQNAILKRLVDFYCYRCVAADSALRPHQRKFAPVYDLDTGVTFAGLAPALAWFRVDYVAAVELLRTAVQRGWSDVAWMLSEALWGLLRNDNHLDLALETQQLGERAASEGGHWFQAVAPARQGSLLCDLGRYDEADGCCSRALAETERHRNQWPDNECEWIESVATNARGTVAEGRGRLEDALNAYRHSLKIEQRRSAANPNSTGYGVALRQRNIAWVLAQLGDFTQSHQLLDRVTGPMRSLVKTHDDHGGYGRTLYLRGRVYALQGNHPAARTSYTAAERILLPERGHKRLLDLYLHAAETDLALRDVASAEKHLGAALDLADASGQATLAADLRNRLQSIASGTSDRHT